MAEHEAKKSDRLTWFGSMPDNWNLSTISSLYDLRNEKVSDKDYPPLSVTMKGIVPQLESAAKTDNGDNRKLVKKHDFAINSRSDRRGSCGISSYDGSVSLINTVLTPREEMHPGYYNWLFHTVAFADEFYKWGHGIVNDLWSTRWQEMKRIVVPLPPLSEQSAIAVYLDDQCAKIDTLIAEAKDSIEEYKQWKASIIFEAVTKGLSPNVKMKSSGIEWIKEMPADWKIKKIKYVAETQTKRSENNANYIGLENVESGSGKIVSGKSNEFSAEGSSISINEGDVVFGKLRPYLAKCTVVKESGCCSTEFIVLRPMSIDANFLKYSMLSPKFVDAVNMSTYGAKMPRANWTFIGDMKISLPSISVQREIAEYLDEKGYIIDILIYEKQNLVADFELYKKSLIYETVTGKRKVV
ncbi:MAG: restriction endonuclease subunit S [Eubacterium sp.]